MKIITRWVGPLAAALLAAAPAHAGRELELEELPQQARQTIERETRDATVTSIEKDRENGKEVYEVEYTKDGQRWELHVAPDGTLLDRHRD